MKTCITKAAGAVVMAGLVAVLAGFTSTHVIAPKPLAQNVYKVEGLVPVSAAAPAPASASSAPAAETAAAAPAAAPAANTLEPISALLAAADVKKGEVTAKVCGTCHTFVKGGANKVGPNLYDIVGNPRAHLGDGFAYSTAMKTAGGTWGYEELNAYLAKPSAAIKGNKMAFAGLKSAQDRANVIAWLRTLADTPKPLP